MTEAHPHPKFKRLLLTGAGGGIGKAIRTPIAGFAEQLRLSDLAGSLPTTPLPHEEIVACDLADKAAMDALIDGCDAVIHMGGVSVERPFEQVLEANIKGVFNLYEGARRHGVKRIIFASSNHVTGFYRQDEKIDTLAPRRPDGYYGLSKSFGEDTAQFYFDRYGIETVSVRIGSAFPAPVDRRMMASWLSYADLVEVIRCGLFAPDVGHTVVFGASNNEATWWDNRHAAKLGFHPRDTSEVYREQVEAQPRPAPTDPVAVLQGGKFTAMGPFETP